MVEYNPVQTVGPQVSSPDNMISTRASPEAFGSQVGQATQKLGATGEEVANQQMAVMMQYQQMDNEQTANKAAMSYGDFVMKQELALKQNEGQNAAAALPGFEKGMQDQMETTAAGIQSPLARNAFLTDARNFYNRSMYSAGSYVGDEIRKGVDRSDEGKLNTYINIGANSYNVPGALDKSIQDITTMTVYNAHEHKGIRDGDAINALVEKNVGLLMSTTIDNIMNSGGSSLAGQTAALKQARAVFDNYKDQSIPDSPGVPIIGKPYMDNIGAKLNYKEYTLDGRQDVEAAHGISETVFNGAKEDYNQNLVNTPPKVQSNADLGDRILQQESGGSHVMNRGQIQPDTWTKFAHPDENINNPTQNEAVTRRIINQYKKDYNGDDARVAVAYFSGPGNVSPPGSETPYITDKADANGKTVSSYVQDITAGSDTESESTPKSFVDHVQANLSKYVEQARELGKTTSGRQKIGDDAASLTETRLRTFITNENEHDKINVNKIQEFVFGKDNITSEAQLTNGPPEIKQAWEELQDRRPAVARSIRKNILAANATGKALTFGTDFYKHFSDMASRLEGDDKPKSENYMHYVGPTRNDPLTNTGYKALTDELNYAQSSPEGAAFVHSEKQYLEKLRGEIVGGLSIHNVNGERVFNTATIQAMKKIQKGRDSGLTADQLFNPESKDYVGGATSYDNRTPDQKIRDLITIQTPMPMNSLVPQSKEKFDIKNIDAIKDDAQMKTEVKKALDAKNMTYDEAEAYLLKRGVPKAVPAAGLVAPAR